MITYCVIFARTVYTTMEKLIKHCRVRTAACQLGEKSVNEILPLLKERKTKVWAENIKMKWLYSLQSVLSPSIHKGRSSYFAYIHLLAAVMNLPSSLIRKLSGWGEGGARALVLLKFLKRWKTLFTFTNFSSSELDDICNHCVQTMESGEGGK